MKALVQNLSCMLALTLAVTAHAESEGRGGGHTITKCDGTIVVLDQYNPNDDLKSVNLKTDPRFGKAYSELKTTVDQIRAKYAGFAESMDSVLTVPFYETCQPLAFINDHNFNFGGLAPDVNQAAVRSAVHPYERKFPENNDRVIVSTDIVKTLSPPQIKNLLYHEFFKLRFGEEMDRDLLRSLTRLTIQPAFEMGQFADLVEQIDPGSLTAGKIEFVCDSCGSWGVIYDTPAYRVKGIPWIEISLWGSGARTSEKAEFFWRWSPPRLEGWRSTRVSKSFTISYETLKKECAEFFPREIYLAAFTTDRGRALKDQRFDVRILLNNRSIGGTSGVGAFGESSVFWLCHEPY